MAITTLTVQDSSRVAAPASISYGAANADGSFLPNNGSVFLHIKNASAGSITVTFATTGLVAGQSPAAATTVSVPLTSGDKMVGPFPPALYNDAAGRVLVTYSAAASLTVAAIRLS